MIRRLGVACTAALLLSVAACGDPNGTHDDPTPNGETEYADVRIYHETVTHDGVTYLCLLAGYSNSPGLWCTPISIPINQKENSDPR